MKHITFYTEIVGIASAGADHPDGEAELVQIHTYLQPVDGDHNAVRPRFFMQVVAADVDGLIEAALHYGESWYKRDGAGAFFMLARKWDRIEQALAKAGNYNILVETRRDARAEGLIDDIRDLRRYLILVEAKLLELGVQHGEVQKGDKVAIGGDLHRVPRTDTVITGGDAQRIEAGQPLERERTVGAHEYYQKPPIAVGGVAHHGKTKAMIEDLVDSLNKSRDENSKLREKLVEYEEKATKGAKFKAYVHDRLDKFGAPTAEEAECRVGARLSWVFNECNGYAAKANGWARDFEQLTSAAMDYQRLTEYKLPRDGDQAARDAHKVALKGAQERLTRMFATHVPVRPSVICMQNGVEQAEHPGGPWQPLAPGEAPSMPYLRQESTLPEEPVAAEGTR